MLVDANAYSNDRCRSRMRDRRYIILDALRVDAQAADGVERVAHGFPDGRVRVNHRRHVVERSFQADRRHRLRR